MPKISTNVQMQIPCSLFKIGDLVEYTINFDETKMTYFGQIQARSWVDEQDRSYWEYTVTTEFINRDNLKSWRFQDSDCVREHELKSWDGTISSPSVKENQHIGNFSLFTV